MCLVMPTPVPLARDRAQDPVLPGLTWPGPRRPQESCGAEDKWLCPPPHAACPTRSGTRPTRFWFPEASTWLGAEEAGGVRGWEGDCALRDPRGQGEEGTLSWGPDEALAVTGDATGLE